MSITSDAPELRIFQKLLIANRSEIAIRIMRAATELGIRTVAIYAREDRFCPHRFKADEAYELDSTKGPLGAYLDIPGIVALAQEKGVDAIHPGYGFLSENPDFARACEVAGITFIGPDASILERMGDKTAAREIAKATGVPVLGGTDDPISDKSQAMELAHQVGFPVMIKAAFGGGGRGMRVVLKAENLTELLHEATNEAARAFGNGAVFLERYVSRAKHIEVQILADKHGHLLHLHERDCSVQRRHQKVIEMAPSFGVAPEVIAKLCADAVKIARHTGYTHAGTVEFLVDVDTGDYFFIEMNPRIQVEHTVTEEITGIDIVRAQIQIAQGHQLHGTVMGLPLQPDVEKSGCAIQCRITTEDPENNFTPDFGRLLTYRSPGGFGVRLDGALGTSNAVITPYYDSMLVKVTIFGRTLEIALDRMNRALHEFRIRGVKTNIPFLLNVINHPTFRVGQATTKFIDNESSLFAFTTRKDRATKLLNFLSDIIVNGNPHVKGYKPENRLAAPPKLDFTAGLVKKAPPKGTRDLLKEIGPEKFSRWVADQKRLLMTDTTFRDAHQSLLATRVRTYDLLAVADVVSQKLGSHENGLFSLEMWGGATFDTAMRFLNESPWDRLRDLRKKVPNILFQMLFRGSNAVGYNNYPDNVVTGFIKHAAESGMDIFRIFDSLNYLPNLEVAMKSVREETQSLCEATICYTGHILDPKRDKYGLTYYVKLAKELEKMGAHLLCIKDMAGLCRPYAANLLTRTLKEETGLPIHFHTHDTSGLNAASLLQASDAGVDIVDAALASMSGSTSQPNLNSLVAALEHTERDTGLDLRALNSLSDVWATTRAYYKPFDTSEPYGTAEVYLHEMPGGQYTNLKEQAEAMGIGHRWPEIARTYAEVNQLFGDIVKVTPSSKVIGDMTMFLISRGITAEEVLHLPPGTPFPESVIDMLSGGLGQPPGGWPEKLQKIVIGSRDAITVRPGERAAKIDLELTRAELAGKIGRPANDDDLFSYLMYPAVFLDFEKFCEQNGNVSVLPTPAFFYGLQPKDEIHVDIEPGKTLFIRYLNATEVDDHGQRTTIFELNGYPRHCQVVDRKSGVKIKAAILADPSDNSQIGAPMPGMVQSLQVSVGDKVEEGTPLLSLEAMKMIANVPASRSGIVEEVCVQVGSNVEPKQLLIRLKKD